MTGKLDPVKQLRRREQDRVRFVLLEAQNLLAGRPKQSKEAAEVCGTPGYIAPEQGKGCPEARSDVFSLGVVYAEMFCEFSSIEQKNNFFRLLGPFVNGTLGKDGIAEWKKFCRIGEDSEDLELLKRMLSEQFEDRPEAEEIAKMPFLKHDEQIERLKKKLRDAEERIEFKNARMQEMRETINKLRSRQADEQPPIEVLTVDPADDQDMPRLFS